MRTFKPKKRSKLPETVELTIDRLSHDGRGIGQVDGRIVMVENALPGEHIEARIDQGNTKLWQGHVRRYHSQSQQRKAPDCELYGRCGGCQLQHLTASDQLALKQQAVSDHFRRNGLDAAEFAQPIESSPLGYRHRARFHVSSKGAVGFHGRRGHQVVPVNQCPVLTPALQNLFDQVRDQAPLQGVRQLELTVDDTGHFGARVIKAEIQAQGAFEQWAAAQSGVQDTLTYEAGRHRVTARAGEFTQVNREVNRRMLDQVRAWLNPTSSDRLLDLFCGNGNISLALAEEVGAVLGLESSGAAIEAAKAASASQPQVFFTEIDLFTHRLQQWPDITDFAPTLAVLDPPRAGAEQVVSGLGGFSDLTRLVYVSCDPATLARDLAQLTADGWHLRKAGLIDMFPQTRHIETMVLLEKK